MRRILFAALAAAALLALAAPVNRAQAMTPAAPSQLANDATAQKAAWRCGWHGCVPGWHLYYRSYPYAFPYVVIPRIPIWVRPWPGPWIQPWPGPWIGPGWGWHRYHHWRRW
jgi:hypothetical protein